MSKGSRRGFLQTGLAAALSPFYTTGVAGQTAQRVRPFLQNVRRTAATVNWISLAEGDGKVELRGTGDSPRLVDSKAKRLAPAQTGLTFSVYHHRVDLTGLKVKTPYSYSVLQNGHVLPGCENLTFQTPGAGTASRVVILGDSGNGSPAQNRLAQLMAARRPDLMLHTGDLVYPSGTVDAYLERFFAPYAPLLERIPVFPCPGNHDYYHEEANFYVALHSLPASTGVPNEDEGRYYSFDWENAHVVVLDSNTPLERAVQGEGKMLEWLEADLARDRHYWKIAMFHHPPYAGGANEDDPLNHLARQHIVPILEKYGVQLVLNGHEHNYQRSHSLRDGAVVPAGEGIVYLTSGGGGAELYEPRARAEAAFQRSYHHFIEAELRPNEFQARAIRDDGVGFDSMTLRPKPRVSAVVNAADGTPALAAGSLASLFGRQLATQEGALASVRVLVNDQEANLVYASPDQLNFVLPKGLTGEVAVRVETPNGAAGYKVTLSPTAPAVLMADGGPALFHHSGPRVTAAHPARVGDELALYFTGAGEATVASVRSGEMTVGARVEAVESQPGVHRLFFRVDHGAGRKLSIAVGGAESQPVDWTIG